MSSQPAEPIRRPMSAETMKMPEPIIDPATIIVESQVPSSRTNPVDLSSAARPASAMVVPLLASSVAICAPDTTTRPVLSFLKSNCPRLVKFDGDRSETYRRDPCPGRPRLAAEPLFRLRLRGRSGFSGPPRHLDRGGRTASLPPGAGHRHVAPGLPPRGLDLHPLDLRQRELPQPPLPR